MGYDPQLHALLITGVELFGQGPYLFLWSNGPPGFVNITSVTSHSDVSCVAPSLMPMSFDPQLGGSCAWPTRPRYGCSTERIPSAVSSCSSDWPSIALGWKKDR